MKILITGACGQLGSELRATLAAGRGELGPIPEKLLHATVIATDVAAAPGVEALDITDRHQVAGFLRRCQPDVVVNCAAYTNVNGCESHQQAAFAVNALGPRNLALAAEEVGARLVHVSTDYVFPGVGDEPLCEYDTPAPVSVYGKTKRMGEEYVQQFCSRYFIVRTAWLYGYVGGNFVKTILRLAKERGAVTGVNDQWGNPTHCADLAYHILKLCVTREYGVYHCTGEGICSWYDFACEIVRLGGVKATVTPCTTAEYPTPAKRPAWSALENMALAATVGNPVRPWQQALASFFEHWDGKYPPVGRPPQNGGRRPARCCIRLTK